MTAKEALRDISTFSPKVHSVLTGISKAEINRITEDFAGELPQAIKTYLEQLCPTEDLNLESVGNPLTLYGGRRLGRLQLGYNYNDDPKEKFNDWSDRWFLFGDEGADPHIIDLSASAQVLKAHHGDGAWHFNSVAADLPQFLLLSTALNHALTNWSHAIIVDEGIRLSPEPSAWLFPRMETWAGDYCDLWCSIFDNYTGSKAHKFHT